MIDGSIHFNNRLECEISYNNARRKIKFNPSVPDSFKRRTFDCKIQISGNNRVEQIIFDNKIFKNNDGNNFKQFAYYVPKGIRNSDLKIDKISNYNLKLNRYAVAEDDKFKINNEYHLPNTDSNFSVFSNKLERNRLAIKKSFENRGYTTEESPMKMDWRMVVGLGNESIYEVSMTLHHTYGIPYIPGSALKGSVRSYIINKFFAKYRDEKKFQSKLDEFNATRSETDKIAIRFDKDKDMAEELAMVIDPLFIKIFGNQENAGKVIFFDSYPTGDFNEDHVKVDIMNNHYQNYYSGKNDDNDNPPADYYSPNPIKFLTLKKTSFTFMTAIKNKNSEFPEGSEITISRDVQSLNELVKKYVEESLNEVGIGAKTSIGYGHFSLAND